MTTLTNMHKPTEVATTKFPKPPESRYESSFATITVKDASGSAIDLFLHDHEFAFALAVAATRAGDFLQHEAALRAEAQGTVNV